MRKILVALALIFGWALVVVAHAAPRGKAFLHGMESPAQLADVIDKALAADPSGTALLNPARCKRDGSCAAPRHYLEMFQKSDPEARLTSVSELSDFLRTLQVVAAPKGEYWLACLKPTGNGTYQPVLHCLSRSFKAGEKAWIDPKTKRIILASDCTNPVEKPVLSECVEVHFFTKRLDAVVRFALVGPADITDDCLGVKRAGEEQFERWWSDECATEECSFSEDARVIGQPVWHIGSYVPEPGEHVLRLPASIAQKASLYWVVLCLERTDASHSDGIGVRWTDYVYTRSGIRFAKVWYDKSEVPAGAPAIYWPWGEWKP